MGLAGVLESIGLVDLDLDRPAFHDIEKLSSRLFQIGPPGNIIEQCRARREERALLRQNTQIERRNDTGRLAETGKHAKRFQYVERAI